MTEGLPGIVQAGKQELSLVVVLCLPGTECLDEATVSDVLPRGAVASKSDDSYFALRGLNLQVATDVNLATLAIVDGVVCKPDCESRAWRKIETRHT